jgi:2-polyprenyl-3-methyl-5-hydroxy-6-metoxy-1,4-benzoquinol methylase
MTEADIQTMFDTDGDRVTVKSWIREGILWHCADAADPALLAVLGQQDVVAANNFLCHMNPPEAEHCLRAIVRLVRPGGHLVISGIDLDVRTRVATALHWRPVTTLLEDIHEGDPVVRRDWPWRYWGLEPLDTSRSDWQLRYATVFQIPAA